MRSRLSTCVPLLASLVALVGAVVAVEVSVEIVGAVPFASGFVAPVLLGSDAVGAKVVVLAVEAAVLAADITAYIAAMFVLKLSAFSRHFALSWIWHAECRN